MGWLDVEAQQRTSRPSSFRRGAGIRSTFVLSSDPAVRVRDPARAARLVAQLVDALTHRWCLDDGEGDADAFIDELTGLVLGALGSCGAVSRTGDGFAPCASSRVMSCGCSERPPKPET